MATNLRKATSAIRKSFRARRYGQLDIKFIKENGDFEIVDSPSRMRSRNMSKSFCEPDNTILENDDCQNHTIATDGQQQEHEKRSLRRSTSVTQSMREAVGSFKQKLRRSTRRLSVLRESQGTPTRAGKRRHSLGGLLNLRRRRSVKMSSPFKIETPRNKTCLSVETPTRLRKEVEDLTSNMLALSTLSPNTLHARRATRKSSPKTSANLKIKTPERPPRRRKITTDIY